MLISKEEKSSKKGNDIEALFFKKSDLISLGFDLSGLNTS